MKKSRLAEMVRFLQKADQTSVAGAAKAHAVGEQTIYTLRKRYGELDVIDEYTRECISFLVDGRIRSGKIVAELSLLVNLHGAPRHIRFDDDPEFVSTAVINRRTENEIDTALIDPGKPW